MSEYQYYEFQAVDNRLTEKQMQELRAYSTRARITPSSFVNEYNWGGFKGNPDEWMERYFDAFLYLANWGTRVLQLAIPANLIPAKTARLYCCSEAASFRQKAGKLILTFLLEEEPSGEWIEGEGILGALMQLRNEIAQGDFRPLYLGWLLGAQQLDESESEPPVPQNLGNLSGPQSAFVDFFCIDPDLLAVATEISARAAVKPAKREELSAWVRSLPEQEKDDILVRLMAGEEAKLGSQLQSRFRRGHTGKQSPTRRKARTVGELLASAAARRTV